MGKAFTSGILLGLVLVGACADDGGSVSTTDPTSTGPGSTGSSSSAGTTQSATTEGSTSAASTGPATGTTAADSSSGGAATTAAESESGASAGSSSGGMVCAAETESCTVDPCCAGLECCSGVPIPPGQEYCSANVCPRSDRNVKRDFAAVDPAAILARIAALPITTWSYKDEDPTIRHIGPMAQDFKAAFEVGATDKRIFQVDADGVALGGAQALNARVVELERENDALRGELAGLVARLDRLETER